MHKRWWRWLPVILLGAGAFLLHHLESTPLQALQSALFDRYQRFAPRPQHPDQPVLIVGIDSKSLAEYGQWPWPRDLLARLVHTLHAGEPLALGLDMVFAERDQNAPELIARRLPADQATSLAGLPDPDDALQTALQAPATVLATIGLSRPLPGARLPVHPLPRLPLPADQQAPLPHFSSALSSLPQLQAAAAGEGFINAGPGEAANHDQRSVLRRVPSIAFIADQPYLSLPLEMVRQALGHDVVEIDYDSHGLRAIRLGDYLLPTQANGEILLHFSRPSAAHHLSAADVLAGLYPPETFNQRLVLIAFNSIGLQDRIVTPLGDSLPGSDIHAQVIESLLASHALQRPFWLPWLEIVLLLVIGSASCGFCHAGNRAMPWRLSPQPVASS